MRPFARHIRAAGQRPRQVTYDACVTAPDETPGPGAPKKAARTAKAPAKKQAAAKKATPRKAAAQKGASAAAACAAGKASRARRRATATSAAARPATEHVHDVVIVGAGPSGASCAYWLAESGWD